MEVNDALLNKLATLSRLNFNEDEKEAIKKDLERMIHFVQKIEEVDTGAVMPLEHMAADKNIMREDEIRGSCTQSEALKNAGKHSSQFFMVPKVIKK
ncbi:MAG TPA: Asp-tRNA(Asn)/Glu-tRNA(Gln) amidotransferase subunit GatC [Ferruginibacter sp.]|nr:Asp-tRNA(Asn)/Glu-tRNA(Gln) amidotransferase subunit GatC [Ferruginibacter sp.]HRE63427.1 Asp-tRNA(Asn)/Glu-tRNA(Gln) amidotransferase subunit GatC [Ferruginibacter sp.]